MSRRASAFVCTVLFLTLAPAALAIQPPQTETGQGLELSAYEKVRPGGAIGVGTRTAASLAEGHALRIGWEAFNAEQDGGWAIRLDTRSGLPALASGKGIPWFPGAGNDLSGPEPT
ncbi:MAG: hypothetical protein IFK94_12880, partial [Acidobacteria bacterium]|nr:hypothetical protein [Candidatus Polarisedimenticola svalbardensis]